jgi:hypothetical protein
VIAEEWLALAALAGAVLVALPAWWQRALPARQRALLAAGAAGLLLGGCAVVVFAPAAALEGPVAPDLAVALAVALAVVGGGPVTAAVFEVVDAGGDREGPGSVLQAGEVLRGGAWIGALERAAVLAALVGGWPEGVAVVLAVKGLGRYPELRTGQSPGTAERFIIGTFTSVLWAVACAGAAHLLR